MSPDDDEFKYHDEIDDLDDFHDDRTIMRRFLDWNWDTLRTWGPALLTVLLIRSVFAEPFRIPSGSMVPTLEIGDHIVVTKFSYGWRIPLTRIPLSEITVPERGDVVVFVFPGSDGGEHYDAQGKLIPASPELPLSHYVDLPFPPLATLDYVKRVVGLPGETIEVKNNTVYIDGVAQTKQFTDLRTFVDGRCRAYETKEFSESLTDKAHPVLTSASYGMRMPDFGPKVVPDGYIFAMGDNRDHSSDSRVWGFVPIRNIKGKAQYVWLSYDMCKQNDPGGIPIFGKFRTPRFGNRIN